MEVTLPLTEITSDTRVAIYRNVQLRPIWCKLQRAICAFREGNGTLTDSTRPQASSLEMAAGNESSNVGSFRNL